MSLFSSELSVTCSPLSPSELRQSSSGVTPRYNHLPSEFGRLARKRTFIFCVSTTSARQIGSAASPSESSCTGESLTVEWAHLCLCRWLQINRIKVLRGFCSLLKRVLNVLVCFWVLSVVLKLTPAELLLSKGLKTMKEELSLLKTNI